MHIPVSGKKLFACICLALRCCHFLSTNQASSMQAHQAAQRTSAACLLSVACPPWAQQLSMKKKSLMRSG